ncbi:von Willebrand factor C and EGF domain-containing isoform X1 [Pelobates cultripes]|uniref:von Willebrand factor C and EGF domain-containing isoform X1 n=1 Tax=Pelobates cultripes TaxID=61616 RepID=A0AAD1TG89_PELCU|nr:von Willebrand factor C and EGF domain-containing isoform X1 [Pelobates cultripes]
MVPFWMGVSCLFLLISGREGRVYNGRKKSPTLTAQRLRSGPHMCFSGMLSACCPGWSVSPGSGQCLQPICSYGCGSGFCIAPNVCSCRDGHQGVTCTDDFVSEHEKDLEGKGLSINCLSARCDHGCRLVGGVPVCTCFHGYTLGKDGKTCYDVDECSWPQASNLCQQLCKNSIGSYRCLCYYGYQISLNGRICIPNKHPNNIAALAPCGEYGCELKCNDGGCEHVSRVCPLGFKMTETSNGVTCTDINECTTSSCEGTCINTEGGFICDCGLGLKLSPDGSSCYDIDECSAHGSPCQQRCKNFHGSYRCYCGAGFILHSNGHTCTDINECRRPATSHLCQHYCHNTHGSFFCSCRAGFDIGPDKVSCIDVDECTENSTLCSSGICVNTLGSYLCSCPSGFQLKDGGCSELLLEVQTGRIPQETEADKVQWTPTPTSTLSSGVPETTTSQTALAHTVLGQELINTTPTSDPHTMTDLDPLPPPQHIRTGQSPLAQKASGISPMSLKDDMLLQHGTPTTQHADIPCWHNKEMKVNGSSWTEPGCMDCTCQEGTVSCERRICSPKCSHPVLHPDSCCPSCNGCQFEGINRADGELFPHSPDNCTICICLVGNVTCIPPVCPPVTCTDPYMSDCCLRCPDGCEFQGQIYPHGAKLSQDDGGCTSCLCQNGTLECSFVPCPSLKCPKEDWILEAGQCCFKCQEPPQSTGCPFDDNGIEIPVGQIWSPGDPCAICICQADGSIECKKTDCVDTCPHPIIVPGQCCPDCSAGCSYGRRTFRNNESFPSTTDPCLTCICLMGTVACSPIECALSCTYPFHDEGECCPVCRDCTYDGRKVLNGQTFSLESDPCTQCTCQNGEVHCEAVICSVSCSHPYVFPGECCSACEECLIEGLMVENEASYIQDVEPCIVCHCSEGNVQCEKREGRCTPCEQKTQSCLNEVPDTFYAKEIQHSPVGRNSKDGNTPIKLLNAANPFQTSRLSLFQKFISRSDTVTTGTTPTAYLSTVKTEAPLHSISHSPNTFVILSPGTISSTTSKSNTEIVISYSSASELSRLHSKTKSSASSGNSFHLPSSLRFTPSILTNIPLGTTTGHTFHKTSDSESRLNLQTGSSSDIVTKRLSHPYSRSTNPLFTFVSPTTSNPSITHNNKSTLISLYTSHPTHTQKGALVSSLQRAGLSSQPDTIDISLLSKYYSGSTKLSARHADYTTRPTQVNKHTRPLLGKQQEQKMTSEDIEPTKYLTGCSLNGYTFTRGSIFIVDVDSCLQCECLKGKVLCRRESHFPAGVCCQDCSIPQLISCSKETNQIHSEEGENQAMCKCTNVILQCHSCTPKPGCYSEGTSQSSESELVDQKYLDWIPLILGYGGKFKDFFHINQKRLR